MLSLCSHYHSNTRHFLGQSPPAPAPSTRGIGRRRRSRRFVAAESGIGWTDSPPFWRTTVAIFALFGAQSSPSPRGIGRRRRRRRRYVAAVQKVKLSSCHRQHQLSFSRPACRRRERRGGPGVQAIASRIPALQHRSASATPSRRGAPAGTRRARAHARHFAFSGANRNHGMLCFSLDDSPPARLTEVGGVGGAQRRAVVAAPRQAHRLPPAACVCLCVCVCVCV